MATTANMGSLTWTPNLASPDAVTMLQEIVLGSFGEQTPVVQFQLCSGGAVLHVACASGHHWYVDHGTYQRHASASGRVLEKAPDRYGHEDIRIVYEDVGLSSTPTARHFVLAPSGDDERPGMAPVEVTEAERDAWVATAEGKLCNERLFSTRDIAGSGWEVRTMFATKSDDRRPRLFTTVALDALGRIENSWHAETYAEAYAVHVDRVRRVAAHVAERDTSAEDEAAETAAAKSLGIFRSIRRDELEFT